MSNYEIREPIQKRSIQKKEKIIDCGFKIICDKGYYNVSTADIAKEAQVSTGIVYQYFKDKHDILLAGIKKNIDSIFFPMINIPKDSIFTKNDLKDNLKKMINAFIHEHKISKKAHQEIMSMYYTDPEINKIFNDREIEMTNVIATVMKNNGINTENLPEKIHLSINVIDSLCHEIVFHKHSDLDYDNMIDIVVSSIDYTLTK